MLGSNKKSGSVGLAETQIFVCLIIHVVSFVNIYGKESYSSYMNFFSLKDGPQ
jgi:hypothetical protein